MTEHLPQQFEDFARGAISASAFEQALLTLCNTTPDSAWDVLALLDQYHRRRKLSAELCRSIRHRIQRHVLGIEKLPAVCEPPGEVAPVIPRAAAAADAVVVRSEAARPHAPVLPFRHLLADPTDSASSNVNESQVLRQRRPSVSRPRRGRTHALALAAIVFGVTASPSVRELPAKVDTAYKASPQPAVPEQRNPASEVVSLSSDQYVVYPNKRTAVISVQRGEQVDGAASFVWWTEGAGAKPNKDFLSEPPRLTQMPDGVASVKLLVPILANPSRRDIEMFYVLIGKLGGGARLGPVRRATVFIMPRD